jgi:hypothetical protein
MLIHFNEERLMTTEIKEKTSKSSSKRSFNIYYLIVFILIVISIIIKGMTGTAGSQYIEKSVLDSDIQKLLTNKAELGEFQTVYKLHRESVGNSDFLSIFSEPSPNEYYEKSLSLSDILTRYKASAYVATDALNKKDIDYLNKIIILEKQQNPFDKLENSQKQNFVTIMAKLDKNYQIVENEFNWLIDELDKKNQEVRKLKSKEELNFWIAISGALLSLIMGAVIIYLIKK